MGNDAIRVEGAPLHDLRTLAGYAVWEASFAVGGATSPWDEIHAVFAWARVLATVGTAFSLTSAPEVPVEMIAKLAKFAAKAGGDARDDAEDPGDDDEGAAFRLSALADLCERVVSYAEGVGVRPD